ncbi:hypothetical protein CZ771_05545 [Actinomycetales bacterium JB111]|nr:hypothetical protein CZ771_05545 [Actinomycetales bacterium JB111]
MGRVVRVSGRAWRSRRLATVRGCRASSSGAARARGVARRPCDVRKSPGGCRRRRR